MSVWPNSPETQALLDGARAGDVAAVNELLDRHREGLRQMLAARIDPAMERRVDASDVVQEVLLDANRRLAAYLERPTMPFHLWLRHLARERLIDAHRRHRVAQRRSLDREQPIGPLREGEASAADPMGRLRDPAPTPAAAAILRELNRRFRLALARLDEQDQQVVILRHDQQLSNQQVARALGLSPAAAGMRYLRAIRRLRSLLAQQTE